MNIGAVARAAFQWPGGWGIWTSAGVGIGVATLAITGFGGAWLAHRYRRKKGIKAVKKTGERYIGRKDSPPTKRKKKKHHYTAEIGYTFAGNKRRNNDANMKEPAPFPWGDSPPPRD